MSELVTTDISITITPKFRPANQVDHLVISLSVGPLDLISGDTLISFPANLKRSVSISSIDDNWQASDDIGDLPIDCRNEGSNRGQEWVVQRNTSGRVNLCYNAFPSINENFLLQGTKHDLSYDQGGLIGSGYSFIPTPPGDRIYNISIQWNLDEAPDGTRAVWTFGEGPASIEKVGPASILSDSVYMVGPIHSHPATPVAGTITDYYGYYWFGSLLTNIEIIKDIHHAFFLKVSSFFSDSPSAGNPYRHFVRNTGSVKSFGGTSFTRSHIFNYDDQIDQIHDYDLIRRMAYEMVHSFLGPSATDATIDWLFEGIKHLLSIYLPFRPPNQFRTGHYFQSTLSMLCMKYYTNPFLHLPQDEVLALASKQNAYAIELLGTRAWAFIIGTDFAARKLVEKTTPPKRPIEDLAIKPLAVKKRDGKPHGIEEWIELLTPLMGEEVRERYEYMRSGKAIQLPAEVFGAKTHRLMQVDQEIFDLGIDRQSFEEGLVSGLKTGSRAEEAGLREGDRITWSSHAWRCAEDFEAQLEVVVQRNGVDVKIKYWPRSYEKAASWQMVKVEDT